MATRSKKGCEGKFFNPVNPKDGFAMAECKDVRAQRVLEFLVLILYPEKPTWITIMIENTIFGTLLEEREVDWVLVIQNVVKRLLVGVGKLKPTPIYLYIFHLYQFVDTMKSKDKKAYKIGEAMLKHNVDSNPEPKPTKEEDSERESLSPKEITILEAQNKSPPNCHKNTP